MDNDWRFRIVLNGLPTVPEVGEPQPQQLAIAATSVYPTRNISFMDRVRAVQLACQRMWAAGAVDADSASGELRDLLFEFPSTAMEMVLGGKLERSVALEVTELLPAVLAELELSSDETHSEIAASEPPDESEEESGPKFRSRSIKFRRRPEDKALDAEETMQMNRARARFRRVREFAQKVGRKGDAGLSLSVLGGLADLGPEVWDILAEFSRDSNKVVADEARESIPIGEKMVQFQVLNKSDSRLKI